MSTYMGDVHTIRTFDGEELVFPDEIRKFLAYGNYGAPPIEYKTRRGYKQDGETEIDYTVRARSLTIELWRAPACSRIEYWQNRAELHNFLRPNRGGPMEIILTTPDGEQRALKVRAQGPEFPVDIDDNAWHIDEAIEFIAYDPIWYDPTQTVYAAPSAIDSELVFPIDFPIWFGTGGSAFQADIVYVGTWRSYPILTLTGPYTFATIENLATNVAIYLTVPVPAGETRIVNLTPGSLGIVDQNGNNKFGELGPDSDLVNFNLRPDPEVTDGEQTIRAIMSEPGVGTSFEIAYNERYYAL